MTVRSSTKHKRRALVVGYDYHAGPLAKLINQHGSTWAFEAYPASMAGIMQAFVRLRCADALIVFGGPAPPPALGIAAKHFGLTTCVQWAGSDVSAVTKSPLHAGLAARAGYHHFAVAPWLVDELCEIGIRAEMVRVAGIAIDEPPHPLPERMRVVSYLPHPRRRFYGRDFVYDVARALPDVAFLVVGAGTPDLSAPANVEFAGFVADFQAVLDASTLLLRAPGHDGMSRMVLEALARGRYVAWTHDLPGVQRVTHPAAAIAYARELDALQRAGALQPNLIGYGYIAREYGEHDVARAYEARLSALAGSPSGERRKLRRVAVSGLDLFVSQIAELAHERQDAWIMNVMRFDTKLQVFTSCVALAFSDVWYDIGNAAQNRWLQLVARITRKPRVIHWVGTDILVARTQPRVLESVKSGNVEHLAEVRWTIDELAGIGIDAREVPLPPSIEASAVAPPLPAHFTILCYVPAARSDFYGKQMYERLVRRFADEQVRFIVVGGGELDVPAGADVVHAGWVASLKAIYPEVTAFIRLTPRDGLSLMVLEALSYGRHVLWGQHFPFVTPVTTYEDVEHEVSALLERHKAGTLGVQTEATAFIRARYDAGRCIGDIAAAWTRAAEQAAPPERTVAAQASRGGDIVAKTMETFLFRMLIQSFGIISGILLARALGPLGKGIFSYADSVLAVLQTLSSGQSAAISWQYAQRKLAAAKVFGATATLGAIVLSVAIAALALWSAFIPSQRVLFAVVFALPFAFVMHWTLAFFLARGNVRVGNIQALILAGGFTASLCAVFWIFHLGLNAVLIAWVGSFAVAAIYSVSMLARSTGIRKPDRGMVREQAVFGAKVTATSLVSLLNFRIDVFIVLFMLGPKALGIYSIAIGLGEMMWQLTRPLALATFGKVASGSKAEAARITATCVRHSFMLMALASVVLFFAGPKLIVLVYGPAFEPAGAVVRYLIPGIIAYSAMPFLAAFFTQNLGRPTTILATETIAMCVCAIGTVLTVGRFGLVAGAVATSVSYVAALAIVLSLFVRESKLPLRALFTFERDDYRAYNDLVRSAWRAFPLAKVRGRAA